MIKGKTKSGFEFEIDEANVNDYRLLKLIAQAETNKMAIADIVSRLFGEEQEERLLKHLEDENGRVNLELVDAEIAEIFLKVREVKN